MVLIIKFMIMGNADKQDENENRTQSVNID